MKILLGSLIKEINRVELKNIMEQYKSVIVDIGTGNGQFIYRQAKQNYKDLFIGVDPSMNSMHEYSLKASKKASKGGLKNILFVVSNVEDLPDEMISIADKISINLPWSSLRDGIVKGEEIVLNNIRKISKHRAKLDICVTYSSEYEKSEIDERKLPELSMNYIKTYLKKQYNIHGINITDVEIWDNTMLKSLDTKWAKKLAYGKNREIFCLICSINKWELSNISISDN